VPKEYGLPKTLYNRWKRWSEMGVFARIFEGLAAEAANQKTIVIDVTYLKAHRTASSMRGKKGGALSADRAEWLLVDRGYDADWFCDALKDKGIRPCIPGRKSRGKPVKYDKRRYKSRNRIEIMFGRLKDWRRVATRDDRCPVVFLTAVALVATVIFWL